MPLFTVLSTVLATFLSLTAISSAHNEPEQASGAYTLTDDMTYDKFFEAFNFFHEADPTQGFVQFQDLPSAIDKGLVGYLNDTQSVFLGVDHTTKDPKGRAAIRLESKKGWNQGLVIADIHHMPPSECGVWPAYWLLGSDANGKYNWPNEGEIDILEGVNDYDHNAVTLHTSTGCTVDNTTDLAARSSPANTSTLPFTGFLATSDCDVKAAHQAKNVGCSIKAPQTLSNVQTGGGDPEPLHSYGTLFNAAGGGIYATEWTPSSISVWFIPRTSPLYASTTSSPSSHTPDPSTWGPPLAHFSGSGCDYAERFKNLKIIINTTFCGEWAGSAKEWDKSCKEKTGYDECVDYVRENPQVFAEAYWEVGGVRWYARDGVGE